MEFVEVVRRRRMVRSYRADPVPGEVLERIVTLAAKSPSAGFSQGVSYVIVTDPAVRRAIAVLAEEDHYVAAGFDPWISTAPAQIVVCVEENAYHRRYQEPDKLDEAGREIAWPVPFWWVDAGAALMVVLLAAVDQGLAAGFLGVQALPGLAELVGLPPGIVPIGVVTIGRGRPDRRSGSLARGFRPSREVIHWQRWGGERL